MRRWLKEPLLHFLVVGGLLFAAHAWLHRGGGDAPHVVHLTAAEVNWLKEMWARQWQRPPNEQELRGLVTDYVKEGLLAREARALGLDENDTIVRRRLAQKLAFFVQDTARLAEAGEDAMRAAEGAALSRGLAVEPPVIVATAAGTVLEAEQRRLIDVAQVAAVKLVRELVEDHARAEAPGPCVRA